MGGSQNLENELTEDYSVSNNCWSIKVFGCRSLLVLVPDLRLRGGGPGH